MRTQTTNDNKTYKQYGLLAYSLGLCIFIKSAKSFGFCFKQGKEKTKTKDFAMCVAESKR
jgi:hypothetical protein